jgi:hypothetical protein
MKPNQHLLLPAALLGLLALPAHAAITYVDAQEGTGGNTYASDGGSLADTSWIDSTSNSSDINNNDWMKRFGGSPGWSEHNGGDAIQGLVSTTGGLGEITTEVGGLADGTYEVWVFFWNQVTSNTQDWVIDAGLSSGSTAAYSDPGDPVAGTNSTLPVNAATLDFSGSVSVVAAGGNQEMIGVNLGQVAVSGGSSLNVYVDKLTGTGSTTRTIYDGVGYELIPEPSTALLGGLGTLLLLRRRRL